MTYFVTELSVATEIEDEPLNVRIFLVDILTFDGFFGVTFDILKPRWLPTPGYEELLAALATPDTPESKELIETVGGKFDPEEFSVEKTNARMARRLGSG
jgi:hypothetical protein